MPPLRTYLSLKLLKLAIFVYFFCCYKCASCINSRDIEAWKNIFQRKFFLHFVISVLRKRKSLRQKIVGFLNCVRERKNLSIKNFFLCENFPKVSINFFSVASLSFAKSKQFQISNNQTSSVVKDKSSSLFLWRNRNFTVSNYLSV